MLHLVLNGMELRVDVNDIGEGNGWLIDFSVLRREEIIYHAHKNKPWLTCDEIKNIKDIIESVEDNLLDETLHLDFGEPDIKLEFVYYNGMLSHVDLMLYYFGADESDRPTSDRLDIWLSTNDLELILSYLNFDRDKVYDGGIITTYSGDKVVKANLDTLSFKVIDGKVSPLCTTKFAGVVGIFINDREIMDIVAELESKHLKVGAMKYIHQPAMELLFNLVPDRELREYQQEIGAEILSCTCGVSECGSPTVFIDGDERYVYWSTLGHNQVGYRFELNYVFNKDQYSEALADLYAITQDDTVY